MFPLPPETIRLDPSCETQPTTYSRPNWQYRLAYARSADSVAAGERGQDALVMRADGERLAFALCDGVSQSFFGDLAARLLSDALLEWLWLKSFPIDLAATTVELAQMLAQLTQPAGQEVEALALQPQLPELTRVVLEKKRCLGSESMFAGGLLDCPNHGLLLVWMGDSRLRLWGPGDRPNGPFLTGERWSSRKGPVGQVHAFSESLNGIKGVCAYSDGLAVLDTTPGWNALSDPALQDLIAAQSEDDCSLIEVVILPEDRYAISTSG